MSILVVSVLGLVFWVSPYPANASNQPLEEQVIRILYDHPEVILESVSRYQDRQEEQVKEAQLELLHRIEEAPQRFVGTSPVLGNADASVFLIEFSDFQCPYCKVANTTIKDFVEKHSDEVALVYKNYPLESIHPEAMAAATAAWAAARQGQFWQYQDFLFSHQKQLGEEVYRQAAEEGELDLVQFERDRQSQAAIDAVRKDMELAERLGIDGTPFFVMGGQVFSGAVQEAFLEDKLALFFQ